MHTPDCCSLFISAPVFSLLRLLLCIPQASQQIILNNIKRHSTHVAFEATAYPQMLAARLAQQKVDLLMQQLGTIQGALQERNISIEAPSAGGGPTPIEQ